MYACFTSEARDGVFTGRGRTVAPNVEEKMEKWSSSRLVTVEETASFNIASNRIFQLRRLSYVIKITGVFFAVSTSVYAPEQSSSGIQ